MMGKQVKRHKQNKHKTNNLLDTRVVWEELFQEVRLKGISEVSKYQIFLVLEHFFPQKVVEKFFLPSKRSIS